MWIVVATATNEGYIDLVSAAAIGVGHVAMGGEMNPIKFVRAALICVAAAGCSQSIYYTEEMRLAPAEEGSKVFIGPYFGEVTTTIIVGMVPGSPPKPPATDPGPPSVTLTSVPIPKKRGYLYMRSNSLFSDTIDVAIANDGMLSSSNSASSQQLTQIFTELGQTAEPFVQALGSGSLLAFTFTKEGETPPPPANADDGPNCMKKVAAVAPAFFDVRDIGRISKSYDLPVPAASADKEPIKFSLLLFVPPAISQDETPSATVEGEKEGLIAFFPTPVLAMLQCSVGGRIAVKLTAPQVVFPYLLSQYIYPKRDIMTGPQDTYSFNEGFITDHKYTDVSSLRTVVDTITAPIRALIPSTSNQTTTQVITGGGKPDQTTRTTQTTVSPPKSQ